jgi:hypothetical protein
VVVAVVEWGWKVVRDGGVEVGKHVFFTVMTGEEQEEEVLLMFS